MKQFFKRCMYLVYYVKQLDRQKFKKFFRYVKATKRYSSYFLWRDIIKSVYKDNIGLMDYFIFRFYEKSDVERSEWAGTGFMYEYQLKMNPKRTRIVLEDKIQFLNHFKPFIKRQYSDLNTLRSDNNLLQKFLLNKSSKLVLKNSHGQVGAEVKIVRCNDYSPASLLSYMGENDLDMVEEFVTQHPALMKLSPSGLNTVRIITQLNNNSIDFLGARLRISVNSPVDNMAAGNLAAAINMETGTLTSLGVYSDITRQEQVTHPVTGKPITGFIIPFWNEVIDLAKRAALHTSENRSVGWDIAITSDGPELIEGNHNWCKLLWQLPVKKGLKKELEKYL